MDAVTNPLPVGAGSAPTSQPFGVGSARTDQEIVRKAVGRETTATSADADAFTKTSVRFSLPRPRTGARNSRIDQTYVLELATGASAR